MRTRALVLAAALCILGALAVEGKVARGTFRLTGEFSESKLAKFSFNVGRGHIEGRLRASQTYADTRDLRIYFFCDEEWPVAVAAPTCEDTVKLARDNVKVDFNPSNEFTFNHNIVHKIRTHFWYFVVADCSLEIYNHVAPTVNFELKLTNGGSHLPADEKGMFAMNVLSSIALAAGLGILIHRSILKQSGVHIAVLMLALAIFDALLSAVCEALHILIFSWNGRGMALLDFASSFFESQTDMIISFLLVSIASGWTLGNAMVPSSSLSFNGQRNAAGENRFLSGFMKSMRQPVRMLLRCGSMATIVCGLIVTLHMFLVTYSFFSKGDDDFDQFHDLEHTPGTILMWFRFAVGCLFWWTISHNLSGGMTLSGDMALFMRRFRFAGGIWLFSMPLLCAVATIFAPYLRHPLVSGGTLVAQAIALSALSWLFCASRGIFARKSAISASNGDNLSMGVSLGGDDDDGEEEDEADFSGASALGMASGPEPSYAAPRRSRRNLKIALLGKRVHCD
eukprot:g1667.t1